MFSSKKKQFVSIVKKDKQLKLNYKIFQDNKILKEENSTFVITESTMPKDALYKLGVLQQDIPHTYLIGLYDSAAQKVLPSSEVDVISYESVPLNPTQSIAIAKNELAMSNRYYQDSGIDFVISAFSIVAEYAKDFGTKNSLITLVNNNVLYMLFLDEDKKIAYTKSQQLTPFEKIKQEQFADDEIVDQKLYDEVSFLEIQQFLNDAIEEYYGQKEDTEFVEHVKFLYTLNPLSNDQLESLNEALMVQVEYEPISIQEYLNKFIKTGRLSGISFINPRAKSAPQSMKGWLIITAISLIALLLVVYFQMTETVKSPTTTAQAQKTEMKPVEVKDELDALDAELPLTLPNHVMLNNSVKERIKMHFDILPYDGIIKDLELLEESATYVSYFAVPTASVEEMQTKLLNIYKDSKVLLKHQNEALLNVIIENQGLVIEIKSIPYAKYDKAPLLEVGAVTKHITKLLPLQSSLKFDKKIQDENLYYEFSATSIVKGPEDFFMLIDRLNKESISIYIDYPIVFSKLNDGIEVKYTLKMYQGTPDAPNLKK
jgi:hypothetical protein